MNRVGIAVVQSVLFNLIAASGFVVVAGATGSFAAGLSTFMAIIGSAIGSFFNLAAYRLPRKINLNHPPSHCPNCRMSVPKQYDVPILGWLMLGGRCVGCRERISWHYPAVEALFAVVFAILTYTIAY